MSDYKLMDGGMLISGKGKPLGHLLEDGTFEYLSADCSKYRAHIARWANKQDPPIAICGFAHKDEAQDEAPTETMTANYPDVVDEDPVTGSARVGKDPTSPTGWRGENGQPCPPRPVANPKDGDKSVKYQEWLREYFPNQWKNLVGYHGSKEEPQYDDEGEFIGTKTVHYARRKTIFTEKQVAVKGLNPEEFSWDAE